MKDAVVLMAVIGAVVLVSCGPRQVIRPSAGPDTCKAARYQNLVGQDPIAAAGLPNPKRVYHITDPVTQDYRPERINVVLDDSGTIGAISCG